MSNAPSATIIPGTLGRRHVPPLLASLDQWVVYRIEHRGGPKPTKVPYRADGRGKASSVDPSTWSALDAALSAAPGFHGIGFVFSMDDGLWGLDLDNCCPVPFGPAVPEADLLVRALGSFSEYSPSGTGLHVICKAVHPEGSRLRAALVENPDPSEGVHAEAYDRGRYFTFTGAHYAGPEDVTEQQWAVDALARVSEDGTRGLFAPKPERRMSTTPPAVALQAASESDQELLRRMFRSRNGDRIHRLFYGDRSGYGSASEADLALCSHLLYWTGGDTQRADRLFRQSGLMRPKWDAMRGSMTYGQRTIEATS